MFLFYILIYVLFAAIMSSIAKRSCAYSTEGEWDKYLKWYIAFYTVICAIRWFVGVDSAGYASSLMNGDNRSLYDLNGEIVLYYLNKLSAGIGLHFVFGMGLYAFLQIYPITKALKEYKYILITLPIVMFGSRYFLDMNNAVRQMIVGSMFIYTSRFIFDKKPWHYAAFILLGATIHQSTYMLIPFYFIPNRFTLADKRWWMMGIFTICFIAGQTPTFQSFISIAEELANLSGYEKYAERTTEILSQEKTSEALAFGPMMLSYLLTAYFTIWFGPYLKERYEEKIPYFNLWYNFSFFYACAYFLICNISHLFIRPVMYFELFQMVIVSLLLYDLWLTEMRNQLIFICILLTLWVNISWNVTKSYGKRWEATTYKVFFLHQSEVNRWMNRKL